MRVRETEKKEIERKLLGMGDYVKMDYLTHCLEGHLDLDTKKFVLLKLKGIYEEKKMFSEAGRLLRIVAENNATSQSKVMDFVNSVELFIKAGNFREADVSYEKALASGTEMEKQKVKESVKEFYKTQARVYLLKDKRKHAYDIYEKLMRNFNLNQDEKIFIEEQLSELHSKLGIIK